MKQAAVLTDQEIEILKLGTGDSKIDLVLSD